jgi:hypothetical protein
MISRFPTDKSIAIALFLFSTDSGKFVWRLA